MNNKDQILEAHVRKNLVAQFLTRKMTRNRMNENEVTYLTASMISIAILNNPHPKPFFKQPPSRVDKNL